MRIFLSYASEFGARAEELAIRLRAAGHKVFFAPEDLPSGDSYDDRIRLAILRSDRFLCFLTPEYLTPGRYTLTELEIARRRWPSPVGRVLPVRLPETPLTSVPAYLRAVTLLEPKGNLPAEIVMAVSRRGSLPRVKPWQAAAALALVIAAVGSAIWLRTPRLSIAKPEIRLDDPGYAGAPRQYSVSARANYSGPNANLTQTRVEFSPPEPGRQAEWAGQTLPFPATSEFDLKFSVSLPARSNPATQLRLCALVEKWSCGSWTPIAATPLPESQVPEALLRRTEAVVGLVGAVSGGAFVLALRGPNEIARIGSRGEVTKSAPLGGKPVALATAPSLVYVATAGPDAVSAFDAATLELRWQLPIAFPRNVATSMGETPSTEVHSLAANPSGVWIDTGHGSGSVLAHAGPGQRKWVVPPYQSDVAFDLRDVDLAAAGDLIWGAETDSTPANAYLFYPDHYVTLDGHKYDEIGCAAGVAASLKEQLYLVNCDGTLLAGDVLNGNFKVATRLGTLPEWPPSTGSDWTEWVMTVGEHLAIAANVEHPSSPRPKEGWRSQIYAGEPGAVPKLIAKVPDVHVTSLAIGSGSVIAVVVHADDSREAIEIPLPR